MASGTVGDLATNQVTTARAGTSVREIAQKMDSEEAGCVVIVDGAHRPIGVVTDRDIAMRVLRRRKNADVTVARDVMSTHPLRVREKTPVATALRRMRAEGIRRAPVVGAAGKVVGLFSIDSALRTIASEVDALADVAAAQAPA